MYRKRTKGASFASIADISAYLLPARAALSRNVTLGPRCKVQLPVSDSPLQRERERGFFLGFEV